MLSWALGLVAVYVLGYIINRIIWAVDAHQAERHRREREGLRTPYY